MPGLPAKVGNWFFKFSLRHTGLMDFVSIFLFTTAKCCYRLGYPLL